MQNRGTMMKNSLSVSYRNNREIEFNQANLILITYKREMFVKKKVIMMFIAAICILTSKLKLTNE